jgi:hypothetical protein
MRTSILVAFALLVGMPTVGSAQNEPTYYDEVVAQDDATVCDETGWSMIESEMTSTQPESFMIQHAACMDGENGLVLLSACAEPVHQTLVEVGPDPGEAWVSCTVMATNGSIDDFVLNPADFPLVNSQGTQYLYSLAASVVGGTSTLQPQELAPGSDPVIGLVAFAIPEAIEPPYLVVWEPGVNGVALDPLWIVVDRLIELPEALT